jgi:predicted subunit of tRNA(5-methylaminomethyl-2-thiouridylate) methyltransferase
MLLSRARGEQFVAAVVEDDAVAVDPVADSARRDDAVRELAKDDGVVVDSREHLVGLTRRLQETG